MGWWWKPDPQTPVLKASDPIPDPQPTPDEPPASPRELVGRNVGATTAQEESAREKQAHSDLQNFLSEIAKDTPFSAKRDRSIPDASLFPSEMSCRRAFDDAFYCQSIGGQFNNYYRYGEMRDCSEAWSSFWFCMRIKSYGAEEKKELVRQHYREKEIKWKVGKSSEDIWETRKEPLGSFMDKDPDTLDEVAGVKKKA